MLIVAPVHSYRGGEPDVHFRAMLSTCVERASLTPLISWDTGGPFGCDIRRPPEPGITGFDIEGRLRDLVEGTGTTITEAVTAALTGLEARG